MISGNIFKKVGCLLYECCADPYILHDFDGLERNLSTHLYGQPLVIKATVNALRGHFNLKNPSKALVLSFHGLTGCGKLKLNIEWFYE